MTRDTYDRFQEQDRGLFGDNEAQERRGNSPRVTGASDLVDLTLTLHMEKPASIAVTDPAKPKTKEWIWLPKSQIEFERRAGNTVVVALPEWLAVDKGLR